MKNGAVKGFFGKTASWAFAFEVNRKCKNRFAISGMESEATATQWGMLGECFVEKMYKITMKKLK